ncbi:MAG: hypothetical protein RL009_177 [Actinomycetota bacterium]|jgi:short-subunit dehydrogenase
MDYQGKTALITGASSGIGVAYAEEFARRGSNLVLVARRADLLDQIAAKISAFAKVKVTVIAMDLATLEAGQQLADKVAELKIDVDFLVNNAGFGTNARIVDEDREVIQKEMVLNMLTLVDLTAIFIKPMVKRNSGAIVNIASTASYQPVPGMAVYAATKSFVRSFTTAVWGEVNDTNVRVLTVSPGATKTEFFDIAGAKPSTVMAPVENVVKTTFNALDSKGSKPEVIDGGTNSGMAMVSTMLPRALVTKVAASMFLPKTK